MKGFVRGFDVRTGKRLWIFHTIPRPGEFGYDTWEKRLGRLHRQRRRRGRQISVDEDLGLVYLPVELPTGDYYGGHRPGNGLFGESIVAVDLNTGVRKWHYQLVHHGIWDMDIPCAPMLVDITVNGRAIKALAQPTKQAFLYMFDRTNGPAHLAHRRDACRAVHRSGRKDQPHAALPHQAAGLRSPGLSLDDLIDFTPELHAEALKIVSHVQDRADLHAARGEQGRAVLWARSRWPPRRRNHLARRIVRSRNAHRYVYFATLDHLGLVPGDPGTTDFAYVQGHGAGRAPDHGGRRADRQRAAGAAPAAANEAGADRARPAADEAALREHHRHRPG